MFYFIFILHVRSAVFYNVVKPRNNSEMLKLYSFITYVLAAL